MPFLIKKDITDFVRLGVWEITEEPAFFLEKLTLSEEENLYYQSIRNETRKKQWLCYRFITGELCGCSVRIRYDDHGKPGLKGMDLLMSVSHSGEMAAVIISEKNEVGIDIERIRDRIERVKDRFLSAEELNGIGTKDRLEKLHVIWGAKESLYKIHGKPEVEFCRDIIIESFDYLCSGKGECTGRMVTPGGQTFYDIFYEKISGYLLVYAMKKETR
jgi:phosphopantetheinyl transferase (holo-ACP synthase)